MSDSTLSHFFKSQLPGIGDAQPTDNLVCDVRLDRNESPHDLPLLLKQAAFDRARKLEWNRYSTWPEDFVAKLAAMAGCQPEQIVLGHGVTDLARTILLATLQAGRRAIIPDPSPTIWARLARLTGAEVSTPPMEPGFGFPVSAIEKEADTATIVVLSSPHDPTGAVINPTDLEHLVTSTPPLYVVDESGFEFHGETAIDLTGTYRNVVALRSFSSALSLAGLRFGFAVAHPETAAMLRSVTPPAPLGLLTRAAAEVAMEHIVTLKTRVEETKRERERLSRKLRQYQGVTVYPSRANFLMFETDRPARAIWKAMLTRNVLVKDVSAECPQLPRALRVTVGTQEQCDAFLKALEYAIAQTPPEA